MVGWGKMALLYEEFTLCGLRSGGAVRAVEAAGPDCVVVTHEERTVTVYKVSDQKPLGSWTVKQTQKISCPAVYNGQTGEYIMVHDHKVLRIWNKEDANLEKTFKATLAAEVHQIHALPKAEPLVLFKRGGVRQLDDLLSDPQQEVESVLSAEEVIRWSTALLDAESPVLIFVTEKDRIFQVYSQKLKFKTQHKYKFDSGDLIGYPVSFALSLEKESTTLICLYSTGCIYKIKLTLNRNSAEEQVLPLSLLLKLPGCVDSPVNATILALDETHIAVLRTPQSQHCEVRDSLSIWNTRFQTLQSWKELPEGSSGQFWCHNGQLFVPHGMALTVVPFSCETSCLAAVLGKLKQPSATVKPLSTVMNWNAMLRDQKCAELQSTLTFSSDELTPSEKQRSSEHQIMDTQSQPTSLDLTEIKTGTNEKIDKQLKLLLSNLLEPNAQLMVAQIATILVNRCMAQKKFYPQNVLVKLLQTRMLSYSLCPDLIAVALDKADYYLLQLCLQLFPDVPEAVVCACLKCFLSASESDLEKVIVDLGSVVSYMEFDQSSSEKMEIVENGFGSILVEEDSSDVPAQNQDHAFWEFDTNSTCPVGLKKAALLNEILLSSYSETFLLPPLKDLAIPQVILFLQYLQFLYVKQCKTINAVLPGERIPTVSQVLDWINLLLDAHFTMLVMTSDAHGFLHHLNKFIRSQVRFYSALNKIEGSLQKLHELTPQNDGLYSIEVIEII